MISIYFIEYILRHNWPRDIKKYPICLTSNQTNMFGFLLWWFLFFITLFENSYNSRTKPQFYEFLVVECYISFNMHSPQSLLKYEIFIIKFPKYLLFIFLVLNPVFIPMCQDKTIQDDISAKTIRIWLHPTVSGKRKAMNTRYNIKR